MTSLSINKNNINPKKLLQNITILEQYILILAYETYFINIFK